jgi:hypothetical protein
MGAGLLAVKSGFILFIKNYQFPIQINTLEREREREREREIASPGLLSRLFSAANLSLRDGTFSSQNKGSDFYSHVQNGDSET